MKNLGFFVWAALVLVIIVFVYSKSLRQLVRFKQAADQSEAARSGLPEETERSASAIPGGEGSASEARTAFAGPSGPPSRPDPKRQHPLSDLPAEGYPFLPGALPATSSARPAAEEGGAESFGSVATLTRGPAATVTRPVPHAGTQTSAASKTPSAATKTPAPVPGTRTPVAVEEPPALDPQVAFEEGYREIQSKEKNWRKYPPTGLFLVKLRTMYRSFGKEPIHAGLAERVASDVARLDAEIEAAEDIHKDLLRRERELKQSDSEDAWLLKLIGECVGAEKRYVGTSARQRLKTLAKRWKDHNENSLELLAKVKDKEAIYRKRKSSLKSLPREYRSICMRYPGTEGAVAARRDWQRMKDELGEL